VPVDADRYAFASFRLYSATRTAAVVSWDGWGPDAGRCPGTGPTFVVEPGWNTYDVAPTTRGQPDWGRAIAGSTWSSAGATI
jgi:hypothetical protein